MVLAGAAQGIGWGVYSIACGSALGLKRTRCAQRAPYWVDPNRTLGAQDANALGAARLDNSPLAQLSTQTCDKQQDARHASGRPAPGGSPR